MTTTEKIDAAIRDVLIAGNLLTVGFMHKYEQLDVIRMAIRHGDRIAQAMIIPVPDVNFIEVDELTETVRGAGGFGSTGKGVLT